MEFENIKIRLNKLREIDHSFKLFGANGHKYNLNPPLTAHQIEKIEEKYKIKLPEEYRTFLQQIGNGGAGPNYGIIPINKILEREIDFEIGDLTKSFPHSTKWNLNPPKPNDDNEEWFLDNYYNSKWINGSIPISDMGCCKWMLLIVTGKEKGTIWRDYRVENKGITPLKKSRKDKRRIRFLEWYIKWLDNGLIYMKRIYR
ncbi:MAG: SMI1/KNR4 family protein [Candidatus Lokiarchaeota archaeon]|nr:SMI1/KNR4 family protein [Candidatus Lokiarchaeota archaeon]